MSCSIFLVLDNSGSAPIFRESHHNHKKNRSDPECFHGNAETVKTTSKLFITLKKCCKMNFRTVRARFEKLYKKIAKMVMVSLLAEKRGVCKKNGGFNRKIPENLAVNCKSMRKPIFFCKTHSNSYTKNKHFCFMGVGFGKKSSILRVIDG